MNQATTLSRRRLVASAAALALASPHYALAQAPAKATSPWPTRPVRLMVGFPAGSTPDLLARTVAEPLAQALGQPVVVENRPGASGNIAADLVAKASDGHTFGVMINGNLTIAKLLNPATPYDPQRDLLPLNLIGTAPLLLTAATSTPADASAFFSAARAAGNRWSYGTPGVGTVGHLGMELLKTKAGIDPVHVPYPGNPQVITAMLSGQIQLALLPPGLAAAHIRAGRLRAVGLTSAGRSALAPEFPSLAELGVSGYELEIWNAAAAPSSMPKPIAQRLSALISEIVRRPDIRQKLFTQGWQVAGTGAEGLARRMQADTQMLGEIIRSRAITVQ